MATDKRPTKKELYQVEQLKKITEKCDWGCQMDGCQEDPRWSGWPCGGQHVWPPNYNSNAHGAWKHCTQCDFRLQYIPFYGAPATHLKQMNTNYVKIAQTELMHDLPLSHVDAKAFHKKIEEIAKRYKEQRSSDGGARTNRPRSSSRPRDGPGGTVPPSATAPPAAAPPPAVMASAAAAASIEDTLIREPRDKRVSPPMLSPENKNMLRWRRFAIKMAGFAEWRSEEWTDVADADVALAQNR